MDPKLWGKCGWDFSHYVTLGYPDYPTQHDKRMMKQYFNTFPYILPCDTCRYNLLKHYNYHPLTNNILSSKRNLVRWFIDIHNMSNRDLGKKELSYDQIISELLKDKSDDTTKNNVIIIMIIIVVMIMIYSIQHK